MFKKFFQRYIPDRDYLKKNKSLRFLGDHLFNVNLWHFNRRSVAKACAVGIFCAFIPMPFQMVPAAALAIYLRCNLPISIALVWITNPLTMPVIFFFTYKVGCILLNIPPNEAGFQFNWEWLTAQLSRIWVPLYLGSILCGTIAAAVSYFAIRIAWRIHVIRAWKYRYQDKKD